MTIKIDEDNITVSPTEIDDTDSPYLSNGEQYIYVDTTNGPVTIQLASSDTADGAEIRVIDTGESASTNAITIQTEGTENINPGSNSSITVSVDGAYVDLFSDGSNWFSDRRIEKEGGKVGTETDRFTAFADTMDANSANVGTLNDAPVLSEDTDDFGAALGALLPDLSTGDTVLVPPVNYSSSTKVTVDKKITLYCPGMPDRPDSGARVSKANDTLLIDTDPTVGINVHGIEFHSSLNDSTGAITVHGRSHFENCYFNSIGGHGVYFHQEGGADNLNGSTTHTVAGRICDGPLLKTENTSGDAPNINAMRFHISDSFQNLYAVENINGQNVQTDVVKAEGSDHNAVVKHNDLDFARLGYVEGDVPIGHDFQGTNAFGMSIYNNAVSEFNFGLADNIHLRMGDRYTLTSGFNDIELNGDLNLKTGGLKNVAEGAGSSDPTTAAPDGWLEYVTQAGNTRYIPFYT